MDKTSKKIPKDGDILVLEKNRNMIYSYNGKGKTFNAFKVAVYVSKDGNCDVIYYKDDDNVIAHHAPYDFATPEEIKIFKDAIKNDDEYNIIPFTESVTDILCDFLQIDEESQINNVRNDVTSLINKYSF